MLSLRNPRESEKGALRETCDNRPHFSHARVQDNEDGLRKGSAPRTGPPQSVRGFHIEAAVQSSQRALGKFKIFHWIQQSRCYRHPLRNQAWFSQSRGCQQGTEIPVRERADPTQTSDAKSGYPASEHKPRHTPRSRSTTLRFSETQRVPSPPQRRARPSPPRAR